VRLAAIVRRSGFQAVHLGDVRVVERSQRLCLAVETGEPLRVRGEDVRQNLDRDVALRRVSRARYTSPMPPAPSGATSS
jgi:hypothetical protein